MSNLLKIRTLIDRFMEGETTLEEERELYAFFREEEVPDDLLPLRSLFMGMEAIEVKEERGERKEERKRRGVGCPLPLFSYSFSAVVPCSGISNRRSAWRISTGRSVPTAR